MEVESPDWNMSLLGDYITYTQDYSNAASWPKYQEEKWNWKTGILDYYYKRIAFTQGGYLNSPTVTEYQLRRTSLTSESSKTNISYGLMGTISGIVLLILWKRNRMKSG
ncbi:hypothetical protein CEE45_08950 [Candidatus Heimdallarchaeota archaeon B3_Heim]|nr:MAG: hypothetical protein CEE45_08950 [Candidatus Heimdallarchaeota archaeon B3_Heim]